MDNEEKDMSQAVLDLEGALTLDRAQVFKTLMKDFIHSNDYLVLNLEDSAEIDLSFLELLCSAHKTLANLNKYFSVTGTHTAVFQKAVHKSGFSHCAGCSVDSPACCFREDYVGYESMIEATNRMG